MLVCETVNGVGLSSQMQSGRFRFRLHFRLRKLRKSKRFVNLPLKMDRNNPEFKTKISSTARGRIHDDVRPPTNR